MQSATDANAVGLSMGELRQKLQVHLKANGSLRQLKTQLRSMILSEVVQGGVVGKATTCSPAGTNTSICDAIVAQYLQATSRPFSASVFVSEAAPSIAAEELSSLLQLNNLTNGTFSTSALSQIVTKLQKSFTAETTHRSIGCQTVQEDPEELSMEKKLAIIDAQWALKQRNMQESTRANFELQLAIHGQEIEAAMREDLVRQVQRFRATELAEVKKQEQARFDGLLRIKQEEFREMERSIQHRLDLERNRLDQLRKDTELRVIDMERRAKQALSLVEERDERIAFLDGQVRDYSERMQRLRADQLRYEELANQRLQDLEMARLREQRRIDDIRRLQADHLIEMRLRSDEAVSGPPQHVPRQDCWQAVTTSGPRQAEKTVEAAAAQTLAPPPPELSQAIAAQPQRAPPTNASMETGDAIRIPKANSMPIVNLVRPMPATDAPSATRVSQQLSTPRATESTPQDNQLQVVHSPQSAGEVTDIRSPETERHPSQQLSQLSSIAVQSAMHRTQAQVSEIARSSSEETTSSDSHRSQPGPPTPQAVDESHEVAVVHDQQKQVFTLRSVDLLEDISRGLSNIAQDEFVSLLAGGGKCPTCDITQLGVPPEALRRLVPLVHAKSLPWIIRRILALVIQTRIDQNDIRFVSNNRLNIDNLQVDLHLAGYKNDRVWNELRGLDLTASRSKVVDILRTSPELWDLIVDEQDERAKHETMMQDEYAMLKWDITEELRRIIQDSDAQSGVHTAAAPVVPVFFADNDSDDDVSGLLHRSSGSNESF